MTNEKTRQFLSTLWIFLLLNIVFRDIHEITTAAFLNQALSGAINGNVITEELMLLGFVLIEIPLAMIIGSLFLPARLCKWATVVAVVVTGVVLSLGFPGDLDDRAFAIVEFITFGFIIWLAWHLPTTSKLTAH